MPINFRESTVFMVWGLYISQKQCGKLSNCEFTFSESILKSSIVCVCGYNVIELDLWGTCDDILFQASMKLGDFKKSRDYLIRACRLAPGSQEIRLELQKLDR